MAGAIIPGYFEREDKDMRITIISIWAWTLIILAGKVVAMPVIGYTPKVPAYIEAISNLDSLSDLLKGASFNDKLAIFIRIGEIGDTRGLKILMDAFENQPYDNAIEAAPGIKYYCLESIGKIGGPDAESFLKTVVINLSKEIKVNINSFTSADSVMTLGACLRALGSVGTISAGAFLDSVSQNSDFKPMLRSIAYLEAIKIEIKNNISLKNGADTSQFLLIKWVALPWTATEYSTHGANMNYFFRNDIESLIYQYRSITYPLVLSLIDQMNPNDPKTSALIKLKERIEANPSH
jgi:hypothetical protein